jgi:guanine nucleotide-binding protein G(i) subunit alpha
MKIIHQNGYTNEELALYRHTIFKNVVDCAKALIGAMRQFDIEVEDPANQQHCDFLMEHTVDPDPNSNLDPRAGEAVASLWKDPCVPKVMNHQNEFYMMDSAP